MWPLTSPFDLILQILDISPHFHSVKFDVNSFIDDRYMATVRLRGFGCEIPIPANFGKFWGFDPKIVKLLFWPPKVRTSRGNTRFEILPIWGEAPSNGNVTKFCMWVPFPDVIICARFYLYRPNSFWGADPQNWLFPLTWRATLTSARALPSSAVISAKKVALAMHLKSFWRYRSGL